MLRQSVADLLSPRVLHVSPQFHAILACLLGQEGWSRPELAALTVTSDGYLLGRVKGDVGFNSFLGTKADLDQNLEGVAACVGLTPRQRAYLLSLSPT
jgi:hypothetical protein